MKPIKSSNPGSKHRILDRAFLLPFIGLLLFLPPFSRIFQLDIRVANIPFTALYLFVAWALLIVGAALLSKKLRALDSALTDADTTPTEEQ